MNIFSQRSLKEINYCTELMPSFDKMSLAIKQTKKKGTWKGWLEGCITINMLNILQIVHQYLTDGRYALTLQTLKL